MMVHSIRFTSETKHLAKEIKRKTIMQTQFLLSCLMMKHKDVKKKEVCCVLFFNVSVCITVRKITYG